MKSYPTNLEVSKLLKSVSAAYKLKGANRYKFQIIAYERAAGAVEHLSVEAKDLWDDNKLDSIPGIGEKISQYLGQVFNKGKSDHFEKVVKDFPPAVFELIAIPGVGPKTALKLCTHLNIRVSENAINELEKKLKEFKGEQIDGLKEKSIISILEGIDEIKKRQKRFLFPFAQNIALDLINHLKTDKFTINADVLGSLRRKAPTVGDIDIAVSTTNPQKTIDHFTNYKNASKVLEKGKTSASIILPSAIQVDIITSQPDSYGSLLQHFTGSKHHNIKLRELAQKKSLSLSEYGIKDLKTKKLTKFQNEKDLYNHLGISFIPPELREDAGEIEYFNNHNTISLIDQSDVLSDLQIHSDFDIETSHDLGSSSMRDIVLKADKLGYEYVAFTEHNPSHSKHTHQQILDLLKIKQQKVAEINEWIKEKNLSIKKVFNSLEIDILPNGDLPLNDESLETLDFALVSIHSSFRSDKVKTTKRVLSALARPKVKIFAHPTGRKINEREGVELDWEKVFEYCSKNDKWLEINADPMRLDLPDYLVKQAVDKKIMLTLGTDAHHTDHMDNMIYAVNVARRGWASKQNIINTRKLEEFEKIL